MYVLIVIGAGALSGLGFSATFGNKNACESARATVMETFEDPWKIVVTSLCVPYVADTHPPEKKP